jgi:hypothetical protein
MAVALYLLLVELRVPAAVAVAVVAVFVLLPTYSTDRFWFAAFGYPVTMTAYLLSSYANVGALRSWSRAERWRAWKAFAVAAMLVSGFGYEVVLPLFVANIAVSPCTRGGRRRGGRRPSHRSSSAMWSRSR